MKNKEEKIQEACSQIADASLLFHEAGEKDASMIAVVIGTALRQFYTNGKHKKEAEQLMKDVTLVLQMSDLRKRVMSEPRNIHFTPISKGDNSVN